MCRKRALNHFTGEIGNTLTPSCSQVWGFFSFSGKPFLGSLLPTHGLSCAHPRHWCVKYSVNLLYDIPTLVKEGKSMVKSMISFPFPHNPFLLILNGIKW